MDNAMGKLFAATSHTTHPPANTITTKKPIFVKLWSERSEYFFIPHTHLIN